MELTNKTTGDCVTVDPNDVTAVHRLDDGGCRVETKTGCTVTVTESHLAVAGAVMGSRTPPPDLRPRMESFEEVWEYECARFNRCARVT